MEDVSLPAGSPESHHAGTPLGSDASLDQLPVNVIEE